MVVLRNGLEAMGRYEVTVGEYRAFAAATGDGAGGGCNGGGEGDSWRNPGFPQTDRHPVTCIGWQDAQEYVSWLNRRTGALYRIPTWDAWTEAALFSPSPTRCDLAERPNGQSCSVDSAGGSASVIRGMFGNVWEWTSDCFMGDCGRRVLVGGRQDWSEGRLVDSGRRSDTGLRVFTTRLPPALEAVLGLDRRERQLIQHGLRSEGFDPGTPNGFIGPPARAAIRDWQASRGATVSGYLTWQEAELLRLAGAAWTANCDGWSTFTFFANASASELRACVAGGDDVRARDEFGNTPLHLTDDPAVVHAFLAAGADLEVRNHDGRTPLQAAAEEVRVSVVEALLSAGADPMAMNHRHESLLYRVADSARRRWSWGPAGRVDSGVKEAASVVRALVEAGADVSSRDYWFETPLHVAAGFGSTAVVEALLAAGADAMAQRFDGVTPLHAGSDYGGNRSVVEMLLAAGADVAARNDDGETPLHTAARVDTASRFSSLDHGAIVEALLAAGADVAALDGEGETPLHGAALAGDVSVVEALLAAGADATAQDREGETPLHKAALAGHVSIVEALLTGRADVTAQDNDGETALHRAADRRSVDLDEMVGVVGTLLAAGADPTVRNAAGETAPGSASAESEWLFWQSVTNSTNPMEFEAYLERFPKGLFRALASGRLAMLDPRARVRRSAARPGRRTAGANGRLQPGAVFRDCEVCPEMVVIAGGRLALGRYEVTVGEYRAFASATAGGSRSGCSADGGDSGQDPGFPQTYRHPMTCVSWDDAQAYVSWLSRTAGATYRLPTEAEWGRAAAGSQPGCYKGRKGNRGTCPVGSYAANGVGLFDVVGNVWEWTEDCLESDCANRVLRGGAWDSTLSLRPATRGGERASRREPGFGFRVASTLD